jgi:type IV pilus assembly protein PilA
MKHNADGFTLIELMIVIAIISILSTMALPSYQDRIIRSQIQEALDLSEIARENIEGFYKARHRMPAGNTEAGLPEPVKIIGNYVTSLRIENGAVEVMLGNRVNKHVLGKKISMRPAVVQGEPLVPIAWVYAYASVPKGMTVIGENRTDVMPRHLPVNCRY